MKTALFVFLFISLPVSGSGNTKIKRFQFPEFGLFGRQYEPPPQYRPILKYFYIQYRYPQSQTIYPLVLHLVFLEEV